MLLFRWNLSYYFIKNQQNLRFEKLKKIVEFLENGRKFHACILNFEKSLFFWQWILWRVRFFDIEFCEESVFQIMNFVRRPFFWYWVLWRVCFSNIEFCEMSKNGLNFSPRQTLDESCSTNSYKSANVKFPSKTPK